MLAILGKKIGMSQLVNAEGRQIPVTLLQAGPCTVTDLKNDQKHGYKSIQLGFGDAKEKHISRPSKVSFEKKKLSFKRWLKEVRLNPDENYELGQEVKVSLFKAGDIVDVQGTSIGKGFAGGMKRWGWRGGPGSHGSMFHRRVGSIGASSFPSRTWPGQHMPGRMGNATITVQNLEVLRVDADKNVMVVKGAVPGHDNGFLFIRKSLKKPMGVKPKQAPKKSERKDPLKASKAAAAGKKK